MGAGGVLWKHGRHRKGTRFRRRQRLSENPVDGPHQRRHPSCPHPQGFRGKFVLYQLPPLCHPGCSGPSLDANPQWNDFRECGTGALQVQTEGFHGQRANPILSGGPNQRQAGGKADTAFSESALFHCGRGCPCRCPRE